MKQRNIVKFLNNLDSFTNSSNQHVAKKIQELKLEKDNISKSITSLNSRSIEIDDQIIELINQHEDFLFNSYEFTPLKMLDWSYFNGGAKLHRGGWCQLLNYLLSKKYLTNDSGILFLDLIEQHFIWGFGAVITEPWVGISHMTPNTPVAHYLCDFNLLLENENFMNSLQHCKGLVFLSNYMKEYADKVFQKQVKTFSIKHPVGEDILRFDFEKFKNNPNKKVIFLGKQMRKISSIYLLNTRFTKAWMPGIPSKDNAFKLIKKEIDMLGLKAFKDFNPKSVEFMYVENYHEYDNILRKNIILIDFFDASANNSVVELLKGNIPFFVKRLPSIEEYLGRDYPMFFDNLDFVRNVLRRDDYILDIYSKTHNYMLNLDKSDIHHEFFGRELLKIIQ
jgi:hypothetical protein